MNENPKLQGTLPAQSRPFLADATRPQLDAASSSPSGPSPATSSGPILGEDSIVTRAQRGDREAFRLLVEENQQRVFSVVMRVLRCDRDTAADLSQEVFLRVFRGLPSFDGSARFHAWLHTIAMNVCITEYRRQRTHKRGKWTFSLDAPIGGTDDLYIQPVSRERDPADKAHHREIGQAVRAAVTELPDEFREAVLLRDLQNLSYEEIADILKVPPGTVRSRIHRGRLLLQEKLEELRP